ncbi:MAG: uridine kinase [Planctomycetota bacterium]
MTKPSPILIGIAGGSASGETLIARRLMEEMGECGVTLLEQDAYYRDLTHLSFEERKKVNFDHPSAFDIELLLEHVELLLKGESVAVPSYDYANHNRRPENHKTKSAPVIIVEGILAFYFERLLELFDIKVYVDTPDDIRLLRRVRRDIQKRGRALDDVLEQYEHDVRPMHASFVEPTKRFADIIVPRGGENRIAIDIIRARMRDLVRDPHSGRPAVNDDLPEGGIEAEA